MNEFLAELYGTREMIGAEDSSDVEKLAEAQILDDVLQSEGIDVDDLDDGTILKLAYEIFGDDSELVKSAAEESEEEGEEEEEETPEEEKKEESVEEKTAEADMLGRIMAHSMVQELGNIELEKKAYNPIPAIRKAHAAAETAKSVGTGLAGRGASGGKSMGAIEGKVREFLFKNPRAAKAVKKGGETAKAVGGHVKKHKGKYIAGGGAASTLAAYRAGKKKAASALDKLAEQRALEILAENGYEFDDGQNKLASAIEQRAWEMLAENGFVQE